MIGQAVELEVIGDVDVDVDLIGSVVMSDIDGGMVGSEVVGDCFRCFFSSFFILRTAYCVLRTAYCKYPRLLLRCRL